MAVRRIDTFHIDALAIPEKTPEGFLRVEGRIARVGIQNYRGPNGKVRRELRLPEEVFDAGTMDSFNLVPVTNEHPSKLLDVTTAKTHAVGAVGALRKEGEWVAAPILVHDETTIRAIEAGRQELSCGYTCELDETPGVWQGQPYDAIQRGIRGNHLAVVDAARAGEGARMRLDSMKLEEGDAIVLASPVTVTTPAKETSMDVKIDGMSFSVNEAGAPAIQAAVDRLAARADSEKSEKRAAQVIVLRAKMRSDALLAEKDATKTDAVECPGCGGSGSMIKTDGTSMKCDVCDGSKAVGKSQLGEFGGEIEDDDEEMFEDADELSVEQETESEAKSAHKDWAAKRAKKRADARRVRADSAEKFAEQRRLRFDAAVKAKAELLARARRVLGADAKLDGLDDLAIKRLVVAKLRPEVKLDGQPEVYVSTRFDVAMEDLEAESNDGTARVDAALGVIAPPAPGKQPTAGLKGVQAARQKMLAHKQDAWKPASKVAK